MNKVSMALLVRRCCSTRWHGRRVGAESLNAIRAGSAMSRPGAANEYLVLVVARRVTSAMKSSTSVSSLRSTLPRVLESRGRVKVAPGPFIRLVDWIGHFDPGTLRPRRG